MTTVQDIFQRFWAPYTALYTPNAQQAKVSKDIQHCRTAALGGHAYACPECSHTVIRYNSCRNRHCPMCQGVAKTVWIDKQQSNIVDAPYFHVVFTVPEQLQGLIYQNQKLLYTLMFQAVSQTLLELAGDKKYLGAQIGFLSILHTWAQDLHYHPHIHTVVMAGGLTQTDQWRESSKDFFIPVKVLAKKFRGKFLHFLKQYYREDKLIFFAEQRKFKEPGCFKALLDECYQKSWYAYTKKTFSGPEVVIKYPGRYTHRIAIANSRIVSMDDKTVTIAVRDRKARNKHKMVTMAGCEFVRRFLMHVLPKGFVKVRYYGLLACRNRKTKLALGKKLSKSALYKPQFEGMSAVEIASAIAGKDITLCPECGMAKLKAVHVLAKGSSP